MFPLNRISIRAWTSVVTLALISGTVAGCALGSPATPSATPRASAAVTTAPGTAGATTGAPVGSSSIAPSGAAIAAPPSGVARAQGSNLPPVPTPDGFVHGIVVQGTGRIRVKPDQATISAGVQTRAVTARQAQAENNATMQRVIDAIKATGVSDANIQTRGVSLYPITNQNQEVTSYSASNNVTVLVDQLDKVGTILDAATGAGANVEGSVQFGLKDDTAARNQALQAAAADAKGKASALASALGLQISSIQSVSEGSISSPVIVSPRLAAAPSAAASVPVQPGELDVTAQVTIVFGY